MTSSRRFARSGRLAALVLPCALLGASTAAAGEPEGLGPEPSDPDPIIGGFPTAVDEFDAVVALRTDGGRLCSGTVVAPQLVLTAAHCFADLREDTSITVHFGRDTSGMTMVSTDFAIHNQYCDPCTEETYDFAYVVLPEVYVPTDGYIVPITNQAEWNETMRVGNVVRLVGFGTDDPSGQSLGTGPQPKRQVTTTIDRFTRLGFEFFAGGFNRDTCSGDSGGPAITQLGNGQLRLAGVTSRGQTPCGDGGWYGVPFAALVWVRGRSGVDLLPPGCFGGDCVDTSIFADDEGRCTVAAPGQRWAPGWWLLMVPALRRRRSEDGRCRDERRTPAAANLSV
ncbi:MAG: trypsin-like serine protease [Deltaproteobacteria bacterium]|nr:trypsin-like serine protease [Deltaproteobacteria bacterium]